MTNNFLDEVDEEDRSHGSYDYGVKRNVRATANVDWTNDELIWWQLNKNRFPNPANVAKDGAAFQASSVFNNIFLSVPGTFLVITLPIFARLVYFEGSITSGLIQKEIYAFKMVATMPRYDHQRNHHESSD